MAPKLFILIYKGILGIDNFMVIYNGATSLSIKMQCVDKK